MLKNNLPVLYLCIFLYLCAMPYCQAAADQKPAREHNSDQSESSWDRAMRRAGRKNIDLSFLQSLELTYDKITVIPVDIKLPALRSLILAHNDIEDIPANLSLPDLRGLCLSNNKITFISSGLQPAKLQSLYLTANKIYHINAQCFLDQFPCLRYLNLNENPIERHNIEELEKAAQERGRGETLTIIANDIGPKYRKPEDAGFHFGAGIKGPKSKSEEA